jgi:hypothetical protein
MKPESVTRLSIRPIDRSPNGAIVSPEIVAALAAYLAAIAQRELVIGGEVMIGPFLVEMIRSS